MGTTFFVPEALSPITISEKFVNFEHTASSLRYSVQIGTVANAQAVRAYAASAHRDREPAYELRQPNTMVTSATMADGRTLYARSDRIGSVWSTIMLSVRREDQGTLNAVSASIDKGRVSPLIPPDGGRLFRLIDDLIAASEGGSVATGSGVGIPSPVARPSASASMPASSGTGLFVATTGEVLTNAHVVKDCATIRVNGSPAQVLTASEDFVLALLQTQRVLRWRSRISRPNRRD